MTLSTRIGTDLLETIGSVLWGFKPNLMKHIVEQYGTWPSLTWFVRNMPTYEKTLKAWGPIRTHLLAVEISVLNSCPYCTYGHAYALQLHYLKARGKLMPVDENTIVSWHELPEADVVDRFQQLIDSADLLPERPVLEQMLLLRQGKTQPVSEEGHRIVHLLQMFAFLNQCGVRGQTLPDQAHDPINKDLALRQEYKRLRSATHVG